MLDNLTKPQRSRLKRHVCWLCEQSLDRTVKGYHGQCCGIGDRCSAEIIRARALACLKASAMPHITDVSHVTQMDRRR